MTTSNMGLTMNLFLQNINQYIKKLPVEDEEIEIICTGPEISGTFSPIGRNIEFSQTQRLLDKKTGRN